MTRYEELADYAKLLHHTYCGVDKTVRVKRVLDAIEEELDLGYVEKTTEEVFDYKLNDDQILEDILKVLEDKLKNNFIMRLPFK